MKESLRKVKQLKLRGDSLKKNLKKRKRNNLKSKEGVKNDRTFR
jgi:hypothetical protein